MSRLRATFEQRSIEERSHNEIPVPGTPGAWGQGMVWQGGAYGQPSTATAMRLSAVFACLRLLSEAVSTLPLDTFIRFGGIRRPYRPRPVFLNFDEPSDSRIDYLSQVMLSLLTDGNAFVLVIRDGIGDILTLIVLDPNQVVVTRERGQILYRVNGHLMRPGDIIHIRGMMLPGDIRGISPIAYARETIGLGLAAQQFGRAFFENGALPSAVIEVPEEKNFSPDAGDRFRDTWNGNHGGVGNAQRIGVLTGGAKLNKVSINPDDAQFLETRAFQIPDVARIFGVPQHLIADASNSTSWGSGLQEQNLAFGQFSLRPWIERIELAHSRLLTTVGLPDVFIKLNMDALLRASLKDRYEAAAIGIEHEFLTINEQRALEDMAPVPWGDTPRSKTPPPVGGQ